MPGFYLFICEQDSIDIFVDNVYTNFVVQFPSYIDLPVSTGIWRQDWYVALMDFTLTAGGQRLDAIPSACAVLCDLVAPSYIRGGTAEILRILPAGSDISGSLPGQSYYFPVKYHSFNQIKLSLVSSDLSPLKTTSWPTKATASFTLHIVRE